MGFNRKDLQLLVRLGEENYIKRGGRVVEIGAQQLSNSFLRSSDLVKRAEAVFAAPGIYSVPDPRPSVIGEGGAEVQRSDAPFARDFWTSLGFKYTAIDVDGSPGSIALDLNFDEIPESLRGGFDLITNLGTTEHVCNQLNAFRAIHDLAAPGAVMIHHLPAGGFPNHGLVNYNPKYFWHLARSNDYKWLYMDYHGGDVSYDLPQNILDAVKPYEAGSAYLMQKRKTADYGIQIALQMVNPIAFVPPLDVDNGVTASNDVLKRRYWTVFQPKMLETVRRHGTVGGPSRQFTEKILRDPSMSDRDISDEIRVAMNKKISDTSDEIRMAVSKFIADSEEAIRNAVDRSLSNSEEAIRNAVGRAVSNSEEVLRGALRRLPGRRYCAGIAAASALTSAFLVLSLLVAGRALHWF